MLRVTTQYVNYYVVLFNPVTNVPLLQLPHHGPILECLFLIFLSSTLDPWAAHFNCADFFSLVADKSRVDPICSNFVVLCIDGNIPKRLTRGGTSSINPCSRRSSKKESSKLHYACLGSWFVPGRNIQPIHVQRFQLPSHITCIGLRRRWRFASSPLCRAS